MTSIQGHDAQKLLQSRSNTQEQAEARERGTQESQGLKLVLVVVMARLPEWE